MEKLRLSFMHKNGDPICAMSKEEGCKFCFDWEHYSHGDTDYESSQEITWDELFNLLTNPEKYHSEDANKLISILRKESHELRLKISALEIEKENLSVALTALKSPDKKHYFR